MLPQVAWSDTGLIASGGYDKTVKLWDANALSPRASFTGGRVILRSPSTYRVESYGREWRRLREYTAMPCLLVITFGP